MNKQMKVTGHGDQSERRNDGTQPNARRDSWSRTEDHDLIGRIKTIELRNKLQPEFTRMANSYLDGVWCRLSTRTSVSSATRKTRKRTKLMVPEICAKSGGTSALPSQTRPGASRILAHVHTAPQRPAVSASGL